MGKRKEFTGTVISDKMMKTVIVKIMHLSKHPKYGKIMKRFNKFKAHDEHNMAKVGDTVKIEETRPISKDKRFRVLEILKKFKIPNVELKDEVK
ncbi:MAG: 30S ribosomal protein S17 [Candidatus Omnitrophota bacterium]